MRKIILGLFVLCVSLAPHLHARSVLALKSSTMSAGGTVQMPITVVKGQDAVVGLSIAPALDYFVSRNFALGIAPKISKEAISGAASPWFFEAALTGTYYFDLGGALYPYIGAKAGIGWMSAKEKTNFLFTLGAPVGVLVALNNHVALNFGVPINFYFTTDGYQGAQFPIGYIGVLAFF